MAEIVTKSTVLFHGCCPLHALHFAQICTKSTARFLPPAANQPRIRCSVTPSEPSTERLRNIEAVTSGDFTAVSSNASVEEQLADRLVFSSTGPLVDSWNDKDRPASEQAEANPSRFSRGWPMAENDLTANSGEDPSMSLRHGQPDVPARSNRQVLTDFDSDGGLDHSLESALAQEKADAAHTTRSDHEASLTESKGTNSRSGPEALPLGALSTEPLQKSASNSHGDSVPKPSQASSDSAGPSSHDEVSTSTTSSSMLPPPAATASSNSERTSSRQPAEGRSEGQGGSSDLPEAGKQKMADVKKWKWIKPGSKRDSAFRHSQASRGSITGAVPAGADAKSGRKERSTGYSMEDRLSSSQEPPHPKGFRRAQRPGAKGAQNLDQGSGERPRRDKGQHRYGSPVDWEVVNPLLASLKALPAGPGESLEEAVAQLLEPVEHKLTAANTAVVLKKSPWRAGLAVYRFFQQRAPLSQRLCTILLGGLGRAQRWEEAQALVKEMRSAGMEMDAVVCNVMVSSYMSAGLYRKAAAWFEDFQERQLTPSKELLTTCVKLFVKSGRAKDAVRLCDELREIPGASSDQTAVCSVISAYGRAGEVEKAEKTFAELRASVDSVQQACWVAMASAYRRAGRVEDTERVIAAMQAAGLSPGTIAFDALLCVYAEKGMEQKAFQVVEEMKSKGVPRGPITYNTLLSMFVKKAKRGEPSGLERAEALVGTMRADGCAPDLYTYNNHIWLYGHAGRWREALVLFRQMEKEGLKATQFLYGTMINALMRAHQEEAAVAFYREMKTAGILPDTATLTGMVGLFHRMGMEMETEKVLQMVQRQGMEDVDQVEACSAISLFAKAGRLQDAVAVFRERRRKRMDVDVVSFCAMMDAYGKNGQLEAARGLFEEALGCAACQGELVPYSTMINLYGKAGQYDQAKAIFERLKAAGIACDDVVYTTMIDVHGRNGRIEEAAALFQEMVAEGLRPTAYTYTNMIHLYGTQDRLLEATKLFARMQDAGIAPNSVTFNTVINIYRKAQMYADALALYELMQREGVAPTRATFATLILMYEEAGMYREAATIFRDMQRLGVSPDNHIYNYMIRVCHKAGEDAMAEELSQRKLQARGKAFHSDVSVVFKPKEATANATAPAADDLNSERNN